MVIHGLFSRIWSFELEPVESSSPLPDVELDGVSLTQMVVYDCSSVIFDRHPLICRQFDGLILFDPILAGVKPNVCQDVRNLSVLKTQSFMIVLRFHW